MGWVKFLQQRWGLKSPIQVFWVLCVFACTGFTVMFLKNPVLHWLGVEKGEVWWHTLLYYVFILPIYQLFLLGWGAVFGQFSFFWRFAGKMWRISGRKPRKSSNLPKP